MGSWNTICMRRRALRSCSPLSVVRSTPSKRTVPAVGSTRRSTARPNVDLPQPDSPTRPSVVPRRTSRSMPSTARTWPTVRCRTMPERIGKWTSSPRTSSRTSPSGRSAVPDAGAGRLGHASPPPGGTGCTQRSRWSGRASSSVSSRSGTRQSCSRAGQRGAKAQPAAPRQRVRRRPRDRRQLTALHRVEARDRAQQPGGVLVARARRTARAGRPGLDDTTGVHHLPCGARGACHDAKVVRDHDERQPEF